ncbi:MAG TPA: primosomal protein N' [Candidatus Aphodovivens avistercoris]|nr:primosomal protein N' [Candidatus Aphodovivens avistercoris]
MKLASVILDIPTQALDAPYTYAVPDDADETGTGPVQVGCAVLVPLGARRAVGFVVEVSESDPAQAGVDPAKLKPVQRVVGGPYFDEEGAACAQWLSERYIAPLSSCVRLFTPPGGVPRLVRTAQGGWRLEAPAVGEVDDRWAVPGPALADFKPRKNAVKQQAIVEALALGEVRVAELSAQVGSVSGALKALADKGAVRIESRRRYRVPVSSPGAVGETGGGEGAASDAAPAPRPQLTPGQAAAVEAIRDACREGVGGVVCVDGVTGSGKTEVYLRAIEDVLARGRTACVLVPEISLTPQTVARFRARFGERVAVMHSRMSAGERYDQWDFIRSGQARVVVGARSALFAPLANRGLIIIDEEHEGSYKQDSAPRYHARDVAVWLARRSGAAVVLGSATPSIETLFACRTDPAWRRVELPERANGRPLPAVQVVDMAREFGSGSRSMFSCALTAALQEELSAGRKAVLLLNQRGFAKFLLCRDCGFVPECPSCSTSLTYHERGNFLICHHCGYRIVAPARCPECGSPYLKRFGAGTQRVEDELRALLDALPGAGPEVPIIRMDADTTKGKGAHERLLGRFAASDAAVLLGTQMIAKGLDFDDVTLVGVINADTQLHLPDYRAAERTFDLVEQVAGRAGRAQLPGRVMVQTYEADNAAICAAARYDRAAFLADELPKRRMLGYPPFVRMANVLVWGPDEEAVRTTAQSVQADLAARVHDYAPDAPGWTVLPAAPCVLAKLRGTYRWHVVVKCPPASNLSGVLLPYFRARRTTKGANVAVDVDPVDLL